jgi:hypothetical protein
MVSWLYSTVQLPGASMASGEVPLTFFCNSWVEDRPRDLDMEAPSRSLKTQCNEKISLTLLHGSYFLVHYLSFIVTFVTHNVDIYIQFVLLHWISVMT